MYIFATERNAKRLGQIGAYHRLVTAQLLVNMTKAELNTYYFLLRIHLNPPMLQQWNWIYISKCAQVLEFF